WTEDFPKAQRPYQEMLGNKRYTVYDIEKKSLFPLKEGEIIIEPYKLQVSIPKKSKRKKDPFDMFGSMSFFNGQKIEKILVSDKVKINVNELPVSPKNYVNGLVGNYSLKVNKSKFTGKVNDAITLKLTLSGSGYLKSIKELPIKFPEDFEVYDPKIEDNYSYSGNELYGSKSFEYILIPRRKGSFTISKSKISYFDPGSKTFKSLTIPRLLFDVEKGSKKVYSNVLNENVGIELDKDIRFIKETYDNLNIQNGLFYKRGSYWLLWAILTVLWGVFLKYRSYHKKISQDTSFYRQKKAVKQARKRLKESINAKNEGDFDKFLEELFKAITGFIADKSNTASSGITINEALKILSAKKVDKNNIDEIEKILQTVEFYRFSSVENKLETMDEL
ncbi:MAG: protein BatD, partial [Calditrichia bacterium]|nr:protein BatD [Calditrichia bacterium]